MRRLLLIILLLMAASVLSIVWVKNFVDRTRPPAPHISTGAMDGLTQPRRSAGIWTPNKRVAREDFG